MFVAVKSIYRIYESPSVMGSRAVFRRRPELVTTRGFQRGHVCRHGVMIVPFVGRLITRRGCYQDVILIQVSPISTIPSIQFVPQYYADVLFCKGVRGLRSTESGLLPPVDVLETAYGGILQQLVSLGLSRFVPDRLT